MGEGEREGNPSVSFADSIPQFSMVVPRLRTVPLLAARCSAPADFASLRVLGAPAASRPPLLASSLVVLPASLGSSYRPALRWPGIPGLRTPFGRVLAPPPLRGFDRLTSRCFAHSARASCASPLGKGSLLGSGVTVGSSPTKSLLFPEGKREVARRSRDGGIGRWHGAAATEGSGGGAA